MFYYCYLPWSTRLTQDELLQKERIFDTSFEDVETLRTTAYTRADFLFNPSTNCSMIGTLPSHFGEKFSCSFIVRNWDFVGFWLAVVSSFCLCITDAILNKGCWKKHQLRLWEGLLRLRVSMCGRIHRTQLWTQSGHTHLSTRMVWEISTLSRMRMWRETRLYQAMRREDRDLSLWSGSLADLYQLAKKNCGMALFAALILRLWGTQRLQKGAQNYLAASFFYKFHLISLMHVYFTVVSSHTHNEHLWKWFYM